MSSMPAEFLEDVLLPLDRWTLDNVLLTDRRFRQLVLLRMTGVCLRHVQCAQLIGSMDTSWTLTNTFRVHIRGPEVRGNGSSERKIEVHRDTTECLIAEFMIALRSARVKTLCFHGVSFSPSNAQLVLQTPFVIEQLTFNKGSCAELPATLFNDVITHLSPTSLSLYSNQHPAAHISDDFLNLLTRLRVRRTTMPTRAPVDGGEYSVTDDGLVAFSVQHDAPAIEDGRPLHRCSYAGVVLNHGRFTNDMFKRLVAANSTAMRTHPLHIVVSPAVVEAEALLAFSSNLSYRHREDSTYQLRLYDFAGAPNGEDCSNHLQIVLRLDGALEVLSGPRKNTMFYEPDE